MTRYYFYIFFSYSNANDIVAVQYNYSHITRKAWSAWSKYVSHRKHKGTLKTKAVDHHSRKLLQLVMDQWKVTWSNIVVGKRHGFIGQRESEKIVWKGDAHEIGHLVRKHEGPLSYGWLITFVPNVKHIYSPQMAFVLPENSKVLSTEGYKRLFWASGRDRV